MTDITEGRHRQLGRPEKRDWGPAHRAKIKPSDIDMIVKSRKGRLLVVEYKDHYGDRIYTNYLGWLILKELYDRGIECWVVAQSRDDDSFWYVLEDLTPSDRPLVEKDKDAEGRTRAYWMIDHRWVLITEDEFVEMLEMWYVDPT